MAGLAGRGGRAVDGGVDGGVRAGEEAGPRARQAAVGGAAAHHGGAATSAVQYSFKIIYNNVHLSSPGVHLLLLRLLLQLGGGGQLVQPGLVRPGQTHLNRSRNSNIMKKPDTDPVESLYDDGGEAGLLLPLQPGLLHRQVQRDVLVRVDLHHTTG